MNRLITSFSFFLLCCLIMPDVTAQLTPFPNNTYVSLTKAGTNSSGPPYYLETTSTPNLSSSFSQNATINDFPLDVNGIGLNPQDNYLYGMTIDFVLLPPTVTNHLYRIGSSGSWEDLGVLAAPAPPTNGFIFNNNAAGAFDMDGNYYYTSIGVTSGGYAKMVGAFLLGNPLNLTASDVRIYLCKVNGLKDLQENPQNTTPPSQAVVLNWSTDPAATTVINGILGSINAAFPDIESINGGIQDLDVNPATGEVYAYFTFDAGSGIVGYLAKTDLATGVVNIVDPAGSTVPGVEASGLMFSADGSALYAQFSNGVYSEVDINTGAVLNPNQMGNFPLLGNNLRGDLARAIPSVTPIKLVSFDARRDGDAVIVNWETSLEENVDKFIIQHSTDGKSWAEIGSEKPSNSGKTVNPVKYSFSHANPQTGANYYRLLTLDLDGYRDYSPVRRVNMSGDGSAAFIYPNPVENTLNIHVQSPVQMNGITIFDNIGRKVYEAKGRITTIDAQSWKSGTYWIKLSLSDGAEITRQVLKK